MLIAFMPPKWNYLRVRGEYDTPTPRVTGPSELPPRARRIRKALGVGHDFNGTTSACAENTPAWYSCSVSIRNYLRVRGEYSCGMMRKGIAWELPPRARRIQPERFQHMPPIGTTSACAENTAVVLACFLPQWNYLRVRGEYASVCTDLPLEL